MPAQSCLLIDILDRDKAHVALACGGGYRLGIITVVLVARALAERGDELRSDEFWHQAVTLAQPSPVVRSAAGFHGHDAGRGQLGQVVAESIATQFQPSDDVPAVVGFADGKDLLCQIHADRFCG